MYIDDREALHVVVPTLKATRYWVAAEWKAQYTTSHAVSTLMRTDCGAC